MKFPGPNTLTLTKEAVLELVEHELQQTLSDECLRITDLDFGAYGRQVQVTFTTDKEPEPEPPPEKPPSYGGTTTEETP